MFIGISLSHRIADICTLDSLIKCWAAIARGEHNNIIALAPVFNSATLFPPRKRFVFKIVMKRFVFTPPALHKLKSQATENSTTIRPTRVEVLTAFLWSRCMSAKRLHESVKSLAYHPINLRGRIPKLTEYSFGKLGRLGGEGKSCFGKMDSDYVEKLLGEKGFELTKENFMEISKILALGDVEIFRFSSYARFGFYGADFGWGRPVWVSSVGHLGKDTI